MNRRPEIKKILYLIHLPPPVHGVSIISDQVYKSRFTKLKIKKDFLRINLSNSVNELRVNSIVKLYRFLLLYLKLWIKLISFRPDYVYFSLMPIGKGFIKDLILVFPIKLFQIKIIYHIHNKGIARCSKKWLYAKLYNYCFKKSDIIHLSHRILQTEFEYLQIPELKRHVLPNGVVPITKSHLDQKNDVLNILFFANLIPEKGFITCLEAIKILQQREYINFKLIIAGSHTKNSGNLIKAYISDNPEIQNFIETIGACYGEKKSQVFNQSRLFIFPSRFTQECMPLVLLEAFSIGMPAIASNIGAIPDIIDNNGSGFLIPPGNPILLAEKIETFLADPSLLKSMGENAYKKYLKQFTNTHFNDNLEELFERIIKQ